MESYSYLFFLLLVVLFQLFDEWHEDVIEERQDIDLLTEEIARLRNDVDEAYAQGWNEGQIALQKTIDKDKL